MNASDAKIKIEEVLDSAKAALAEFGVEADIIIEKICEEDEDAEFFYGILRVGKNLVGDFDTLLFTLDADIDNSGEVSDIELEESITEFNMEIAKLVAALGANEDKKAVIESFSEMLDKEFDLEFKKEVERINEKTTANLKIAVFAAAAMLIVAVITIVLNKLLG